MAALDLKIKPTANVRHFRIRREGEEVNSFNPSSLNYMSLSSFKDGEPNEVEN